MHLVCDACLQVGTELWDMMMEGKPMQKDGTMTGPIILNDDGTPKREYWHWGDMQIVRWKFSKWDHNFEREPLWPKIDDDNHGRVEGMQYYPKYKDMTKAELEEEGKDYRDHKVMPEGWTGAAWDGTSPVWRSLDARYDQVSIVFVVLPYVFAAQCMLYEVYCFYRVLPTLQCVGHCECIPERDMPNEFISIHFSCLQGLHKPGEYKSEKAFGDDMFNTALSCSRYYMWHLVS